MGEQSERSLEEMVRVYSVPVKLYKSEINFLVHTFWDAGFDVKLGDQMNGFKASSCCGTWLDACEWLAERACEHFPESNFYGWWARREDY